MPNRTQLAVQIGVAYITSWQENSNPKCSEILCRIPVLKMTILSYTLQTGNCIQLIMHFSGMSQVQWLEFVSFILSQFRTFFQWSGPVCCNRPPESEAYKTQPSFGAGILRLQVTSRMIAALHKILWLLDLMKLHMNHIFVNLRLSQIVSIKYMDHNNMV